MLSLFHMFLDGVAEGRIHPLAGHSHHIVRAILRRQRKERGRSADADAVQKYGAVSFFFLQKPSPGQNIPVFPEAQRTDFTVAVAVRTVVDHQHIPAGAPVGLRKEIGIQTGLYAAGNDDNSPVEAEIKIFPAQPESPVLNGNLLLVRSPGLRPFHSDIKHADVFGIVRYAAAAVPFFRLGPYQQHGIQNSGHHHGRQEPEHQKQTQHDPNNNFCCCHPTLPPIRTDRSANGKSADPLP